MACGALEVAESREAFFSTTDVVTLHVRLKPSTMGLITADDLALMGPGSVLVNTSRAGLIAPGALKAALDAGRPGQSQGMEDEACTASGATSEAVA